MFPRFVRPLAALSLLVLSLLPALLAHAQKAEALTLRETHGSWEIRCELSGQGCLMTQTHKGEQGNSSAIFHIYKPPAPINGSEALAEIWVPLGVYLPEGLALQVDSGKPSAAPYQRCVEAGCLVAAPISPEMMVQLRAGSRVSILVKGSGNGKVFPIPMSLNGFSAAFDAL